MKKILLSAVLTVLAFVPISGWAQSKTNQFPLTDKIKHRITEESDLAKSNYDNQKLELDQYRVFKSMLRSVRTQLNKFIASNRSVDNADNDITDEQFGHLNTMLESVASQLGVTKIHEKH